MQNDLKTNNYQKNIGDETTKLRAYINKHVYYHINEVQLVGKKKVGDLNNQSTMICMFSMVNPSPLVLERFSKPINVEMMQQTYIIRTTVSRYDDQNRSDTFFNGSE